MAPGSRSTTARSTGPAAQRGPKPPGGTLGVVAANQTPDLVGPNSWMVDEMYEQYLADASSVSEAWQDFFADYSRDTDSKGTEPAPATDGKADGKS